METTNHPITTPATAGSSSCHSAHQGSGSWISRQRGLVFGGAAIVAGAALALSQHWLTVGELAPLLFVLPCAAMMLMCMRGTNRDQHTSAIPASVSSDTPANSDSRN
jgi:DUF2933 family protein